MILVVMSAATRVTETGPLTTTALIVIAIFAVLVIAGIIYGVRQKRVRVAAQAEEKQRAAEIAALDAAPAPPETAPAAPAAPLAPPAEPIAVAPTPEARPVPVPAAEPTSPPPTKPKAAAAKRAPAEPAAKPDPKITARPAADPDLPEQAVPEAEPVAAPAPEPEPAPAPVPAGYALTDVKGLGPKAVPLLAGLGVTDLAGLAALTPDRATAIDGQLGALSGRLTRDRWVEQAKLLAAGDVAAFEATYGKL